MKRSIYWRWGLTAFLTVCAVLVFYDAFYQGGTLQQILGKLAEVLAPVFYGLAMAYLLTPLTKWFERIILWCLGKVKGLQNRQIKNGKAWLRAAAILLTWAVVLALLYWLMSVLIPQLIDSVTMLIKNARYYYYKVYRWADTWLKENPEIGSWANDMLSEYYTNAVNTLTGTILPKVQEMAAALTGGIWTGIRSVVNFAVDLIVGIIISIYLLAMKEKSLARCCKVIYATFRKETAELLLTGLHNMNQVFSGFVRGKLLDSLIMGILCFIGCSILNMPYTPLVSVVVGVTNVIPFFGPFLGAIPSAFLILLVNPLKCLYFVLFIILLQQLDGNVIGPKILGDSTGISSFWVIAAILVGGGFFGVAGMFFGVPVFACLRLLIKWLVDRRLTRRGMPTEASAYVAQRDALHRSKAAGAEENMSQDTSDREKM